MRPLAKPVAPTDDRAPAIDALLMNAIGEYCSFCERVLPDEAYVWHKKLASQTLPFGYGQYFTLPSTEWNNVLLLCWNCRLAASRYSFLNPQPLLYPDEEVTFSLRPTSRLRYVLRDVTVTRLGRNNNVESEDRRTLVFVEGDDEIAQLTIDCFQLNTAYYIPNDAEFVIPFVERMTQADTRVEQRTAVYEQAKRLVGRITSHDGAKREVFYPAVRQLIAAAGYWSVWATVLWQFTQDPILIKETMMPRFDGWEIGAIPDNPFPGTLLDIF